MLIEGNTNVTESNVTVTQQNKNKKENKKENKNIILPDFIDETLWNDFIDMREKMRKPPTDRAKDLIVKDLEKYRADGDNPNEILRQSIMNSWAGVFPLRKTREKTLLNTEQLKEGWNQ